MNNNNNNNTQNDQDVTIRKTSRDKALEASLIIRKHLSRLQDANEEIKICIRFLKSNNKARARSAMATIKNSIIPTLDLAVNEAILAALKDIDSIKNIVYVHQSREASIN